MTIRFSKRNFHGSFVALLLASLAFGVSSANAAGEAPKIPHQEWTFSGLTGHFDNEQLRRGYLVYKNVCSACHGMRQLYYRNLAEPGGPEFSEERVKEFAAEAQVTDGPNDEGDMFTRPGRLSDRFVSPYPNKQAAAAAQGGAYPPDLSVMAKARAIESSEAWYLDPIRWIGEVLTGYQEQGADYSYALLTSYKDPPEGVELNAGMYYNTAYPGNQIAMPAPLVEGIVDYPDGTPGTVENYARDVTAFMMWTAEPTLEERKRLGLKVLIYLSILAAILYLSKRALWRNVEH